MDINSLFDEFVESGRSNAWLYSDKINVYVRNNRLTREVDIANISIPEEHQRKGVFSAFLEHVEKYYSNITIENILDEGFRDSLLKRGKYHTTGFDGMTLKSNY